MTIPKHPIVTDDANSHTTYVKLRTAKIDHTNVYGRVAIDIGVDDDVVGVEITYGDE